MAVVGWTWQKTMTIVKHVITITGQINKISSSHLLHIINRFDYLNLFRHKTCCKYLPHMYIFVYNRNVEESMRCQLLTSINILKQPNKIRTSLATHIGYESRKHTNSITGDYIIR